ncbi:class I SAM-dependent methyltransferase [Methylobacterium sp. GXF4]|uniref:class I SAM-dependent methyltransferase n=1 Tax=Methylobacterium sp. GXF4 TaxID=1096546 RepID=UPI0013EFC22F|nr:class I SAM-dependent methyltransferase [Methylobacterium sp. GXF4]
MENFDENMYIKYNPDIAAALNSGLIHSAKVHFEQNGIRENRKYHNESKIIEAKNIKNRYVIENLIRESGEVRFGAYHAIDRLSPALAKLANVVPTDAVSAHEYDEQIQEIIVSNPDCWILDNGAGFRPTYYSNVVNFEIAPYLTTDVLGVGEDLPFKDECFDFVISNAVLEHVKDPFMAAREIERVLKKGGQVIAAVPFLQPYHGYPHHYYNMTKDGLRNLFSGLNVVSHEVKFYHHPIWVMQWVAMAYAWGLPDAAQKEFKSMTVDQLINFSLNDMGKDFVASLSRDKMFELASATFLVAEKPSS